MTSTLELQLPSPRPGVRPLGDILVERGVISPEGLRQLLDEQRQARAHPEDPTRTWARLGTMLVQRGQASEEQIAEALGEQLGLDVVDPAQVPIDPDFARRLPRAVATRDLVLLVGKGPRGVRVIAADPTDVVAMDDIRRYTSARALDVSIATRTQVLTLLDRLWLLDRTAESVSTEPAPGGPEDEDEAEAGASEAPAVRLLDALLANAVRTRASDVHIEHYESHVMVRFRVDGMMRDVLSVPKSMGRMLTARVKVLGGMDIAQHRVPEDGRMAITLDGSRLDARLSSLPSVHGEKLVIRLLPGASSLQSLDELGMDPSQRATLRRALELSQGLVLITGPTGSGKTNTLYAAVQATMTRDRNVVTLEDPVEIELPGITQVPVDDKTGMTFPRGLRALLRQDPDVVLVGEARDSETAELAMRAAMTGHLVLTTLHTNDAVAAMPRLVDMGVEPYLVASALTLVIAQRLVRRPCPDCSQAYEPEMATLVALGLDSEDLAALVAGGATPTKGRGCARCSGSGYLGRLGLFEVLEVTNELRRSLLAGGDEAVVSDLAHKQGFVSLREAGLALAARGETTYEEVLRVTRAMI